MQRKTGDGFDGNLAVERGDAICHGKDRSHKRADEHGAHDGDVRIDIEADARDEHGDDEDAQVRAGQACPVYKALADHVIGCASLANVERALEEAGDVFHGFAMSRADAVTPMMTLTQSFDLLLVEFHVHLVLTRAAQRARCPNSTPWRTRCLLDEESDRADDAGANANHRFNLIPQ